MQAQLLARRASGRAAGSSGRGGVDAAAPAWPRSARQPSRQLRQRTGPHVCAAQSQDAEEIQLDPRHDSPYERMLLDTLRPDYDDPEWMNKVADWEEFWYTSEDMLGEEDDGSSGGSDAARSQHGIDRATALISQLNDMAKRADVAKMIGARAITPPGYEGTYKTEQEYVDEQEMVRPDPNPLYNVFDVRALAEKRAARGALDKEWRRRQALLARPYSFTLRLENDARLASSEYDWIREEWSHEQIEDLIVGGGEFVHPSKVPATILNPLLPVDFHNDHHVRNIPETEEFLDSIGHLATEDEILHLQAAGEVEMSEADFVDSSVIFEAPDGSHRVDVPSNPWAEAAMMQDAEDVMRFERLIDKMAQKQRTREAGGQPDAGAGDEAEAEAYQDPGWLVDSIMGEGFSAFAADEDDGASFPVDAVVYGDEEEGEAGDEEEGEEDDDDEQEGEAGAEGAGAAL